MGRLDEDDLRALYQCGDVFAMLCRNRWGGLEQEGFGIVFVEAAAAGTTQVAGLSGGAAEAVVHRVTGAVVDNPRDTRAAASAISALLDDAVGRERMGLAGRRRAEEELSYDVLAARLDRALLEIERGAAFGSTARDDNAPDI
jgi:phosphatidylinositol alpha-1,6-mannosyltransferase